MKRTIISTMCIGAALVLASSCNRIEELNDPSDITTTEENLGRTIINGVAESIGTETRAELSYGYDVVWNTGDKIYVTTGTKDDTFTLSKGEGTTKGQFTEDNNKGITGNVEAFYPASLKTDDGYVWPAVQTNNQVTPMYAKQSISGTGNEVVSFSSLGAMLQIWFTTESNDIVLTSITLKDGNKPLSGKFTVTDGKAVLASNSEKPGVTLDLGDGVPVGLAPKCFYIAIPAGKYNNLTIAFNSEDGKMCEMNSTTFPEVERNTVGKLTLTGSFENKSLVLPGSFSIGYGVKAHFSCGNLYCMRDPSDHWGERCFFAFEKNQYDYRCRAEVIRDCSRIEGKTGFTPSGTSGLFQWVSTSVPDDNYNKYNMHLVYNSYGAFSEIQLDDCAGLASDVVDFSGAMGDGWSAPSYEEWQYLISKRTNAKLLFNSDVFVNGVKGAIIAPDDWDTANYPIVGEGSRDSYDKSTWSKMESMGLVFYPIFGYYFNLEGILENRGYYWLSTTSYADGANYINIKNGGIGGTTRHDALPVRLIKREYDPLTVTFNMNGHGTAPADITEVPYNSKISEPTKPTDKYYLFSGWYKDASCTDKWNFSSDVVTKDITLYAKWTELSEGALAGTFTVADGKQVHFSKGNLYYDGTNWGFEPEQFYFRTYSGNDNYDINGKGTTAIGHWGLFGWSTSTTGTATTDNYGMSTSTSNSDYSGSFYDWGNAIDNNKTWRTLTSAEWQYLFGERADATNKYGYATVRGQVGLIILPDVFNDPMKNYGSGAFAPISQDGQSHSWTSNVYSTKANWEAMESAGAIFLPAMGRRSGTGVNYVEDGSYWSSSASEGTNNVSFVFFGINSFNPKENWDRYRGFSVRLVTEVK